MLSIVVTCRGRLHHLRRTLPNMLAQQCEFDFDVIVVDYGCPQKTFDWCRSLNHSRLLAVKVTDNTEPFNLSRARNCGAAVSRAATPLATSVLAFVDADIVLHPNWLATVVRPIMAGRTGLMLPAHLKAGWDRAGTCAVAADVFHQVRGYDEGFQGWGREDSDFYARCAKVTKTARYLPSLLQPLRHGHDERSMHVSTNTIMDSLAQNCAYQRQRGAVINPAGYGQGDFELFRGTSEEPFPADWIERTRIRRGVRR